MERSKLLKLKEVADILRVSKATVTKLIKAGQLRAVKVGRQWRVSEEALMGLIGGGEKEEKEPGIGPVFLHSANALVTQKGLRGSRE